MDGRPGNALCQGKMLYYTQDLPFPVTHTPDNFSTFRKEFERIIPVRPALAIPDFVSPMMHPYDPGEIPDLKSFDLVPCTEDQVYHFAGESWQDFGDSKNMYGLE
ncbi:MAG: hypothetical protein IPP42_12535 [Saprospiraceae bacterium]|nr:hypothetical protein [Saprospiraceae bacterium]